MIDKIVKKELQEKNDRLECCLDTFKKALVWLLIPRLFSATKSLRLLTIRNVIEKSMKSWKVELTLGGETLSEVKVNRGVCQGDSVSPIFFVITLIPLSILLRDMKAGYMLGEVRGKINNLLFMDVLELFGKSMQEIDSGASSKNFQ